MSTTKIVVLDDDPTGSQTVHSCLLLTRWDTETLREALQDVSPLFFVLTNTRGMPAQRAAETTREVCRHLKQALADLEDRGRALKPIFVSRSDSTLRGHYPVETDVMAAELGPFDAHFLVPAFFEGGRVTRDSVHYVMTEGQAVPAHETEFARDSVFGYQNSYLPRYVQEKTRGRIKAETVERFLLEEVQGECLARLLALKDNACCVVDAAAQADLDHFAGQLRDAVERGQRFLFRSGASLLTSLAALPPQPVPATAMARYVRTSRPGALLVGSHVRKTTEQLEPLLSAPDFVPFEVNVDLVQEPQDEILSELLTAVTRAHRAGKAAVIFTSRAERTFADEQTRLRLGAQVSAFLMDVVRGLPPTLGFLVSKGGITSNDVLSHGLGLRTARLLGQVIPGCSVVRCPENHPRFPGLPVVIFPGNVGERNALLTVYRRLAGLTALPLHAKTD